jgi:sugar phosphate isomerase/epimerase
VSDLSRRAFLHRASAGAAIATFGRSAWAQVAAPGSAAWKVGGFTKPIQDLSPQETARAAVEIGWDGIELAVRAGGHVLPERVDEDLPAMAAALRGQGKEILMLATDITTVGPVAERVLRASAREGIRMYRLGMDRYRAGVSILSQLDTFRAELEKLAALNAQLGVTGLIQNHSGNGYVGAAIWDIHALIKDLNPHHLGMHFDIGHATVEGGLSWPTNFALVKDRIGAVIVKDFVWTLTPGRGGAPQWCPLGRGLVNPKFFTMLRASGFTGPITMQFEYPFENGSVEARVGALKKDNAQLRAWIAAA